MAFYVNRLVDDSHEMSSIIFSEKYKRQNQNVACCICDSTLRVKDDTSVANFSNLHGI